MKYESLQYLQLGFGVCLLLWCQNVLKHLQLRWADAHLLIVTLGYGFICPISGLVRASTSDYVATSTISDSQYTLAVLWWCASWFIVTQMYIFGLCWWRKAEGGLAIRTPAVFLLKKTKKFYLCSAALLLVSFFLNPFRSINFGIIDATDASGLAVGGLMVAGIITFLLSAVTINLMRTVPLVGWSLGAFCLFIMASGGSKGVSAVYLTCGAIQLMLQGVIKAPRLLRTGSLFRSFRITVGLIALAIAVIGLVTFSVSKRFEGDTLKPTEAVAATLVRFTQGDVATLIFASDSWREQATPEYRINTLLSFIPGFIWGGKPLNFAYEINRLMGRNFTAASASLYGALYLAADGHWYWLWLGMLAIGIGRWHRWLRGNLYDDFAPHIFWYSIFTVSMLFEGNWVMFVAQSILLTAWRCILGLHRVGYRRFCIAQSRWHAASRKQMTI